MEIVVVSDSHREVSWIEKVKQRHKDAYCFIHCGDSELHESDLIFHNFVCVNGNNDWSFKKDDWIVDLGDHKIFVTHGHKYLRFKDRDVLVKKAQENKCDIVCFGHTHVFEYQIIDGVHLINPGSIQHNRDLTNPSYAIINIDGDNIEVERIDYKR